MAKLTKKNSQDGFTLIELVVSVALFSVVMIICVGTMLALTTANRRAQALQSVVNNLNVAVDGMVRSIREGTTYHCGGGTYTTTADCSGGNDTFAFKTFGGGTWVYKYDASGAYAPSGQGVIIRSTDGGVSWSPLTAPEVDITSLDFFVIGTARPTGFPPDTNQPKVIIVIKGAAGTEGVKSYTPFHIQAAAVQRELDII